MKELLISIDNNKNLMVLWLWPSKKAVCIKNIYTNKTKLIIL